MNKRQIQITVLVDNMAGPGLTAEHGLSLWIETEGKRILFDTGKGGALAANARTLGVKLSETDILVLSHGHHDHTGGVSLVTNVAREVEIYCHPGVVQPRYTIRRGIPRRSQMPRESMAAIDRLPVDRLHWVSQPVMLSERIGVTGPIPRETGYEDTGGPFYLDPEGKRPDSMDDDLALWLRTADGLVVCVGCSHAGLVNTLCYILRLNSGLRIRAVIGGFHLIEASRRRLDKTVAALGSLEPDMVVPCHCTGERAIKALGDALGQKAPPGGAGETYLF